MSVPYGTVSTRFLAYPSFSRVLFSTLLFLEKQECFDGARR